VGSNSKPDLLREEYEFIIEAASECLMEVQLGQIAQQNGESPKVKEFATNMVTDHTKAQELLKDLGTSKNISLPSVPGEKHNARLKTLSGLRGLAFDREYIAYMIQDHNEDLQNYHKEATEGKDPETKAYAAGQLEILQQHLDLAKTIMNTLKE
jgi:putative membrane protein